MGRKSQIRDIAASTRRMSSSPMRGTHFGSQCAIRKSKLIRVTNMSVSRRISCTLGGGSAMASPTMPIKGGADFLVWLNIYCGLKRHSNNTTCVRENVEETIFIPLGFLDLTSCAYFENTDRRGSSSIGIVITRECSLTR